MLNKKYYESASLEIMIYSQSDILCSSIEEGEVQWNPTWDDYKGWEGGSK